MPDFVVTAESALESGQRVVLHWTMTGTFTGPMPDMPGPTGASFEQQGVDLIDVGPDGIRSIVGFFDQVTLWRQLGIEMKLAIAE